MIPQTTVVFGVLCGTYAPKLGFWQSSLAANAFLSTKGIHQIWLSNGGDHYLDKARNNLVSKALNDYPAMTHFVFIDDDVTFPQEALLELINSGRDVCAGVYPKKSDAPDFPCNLYHDQQTMRPIGKDGWYRAQDVPTGFLCIKAHVLRKMAETAPKYRDLDGSICWNIFEDGYRPWPEGQKPDDGTDGQWWGEDTYWCRKYREAGGEIWVKADIPFKHTGHKEYPGNFADRVKITETGTIASNKDGRIAFFATPSDVPEGWAIRTPSSTAGTIASQRSNRRRRPRSPSRPAPPMAAD